MTRWQRWARFVLLAFTVVFAVVVYRGIRPRQSVAPPPAVARRDPGAMAESTGGRLQLARGTEPDYVITYGSALAYADGAGRYRDGVSIHVPQRSGRSFTLDAAQADVTSDQSSVTVEGGVRLRASDGFDLQGASASYASADEIVRVPGEVRFSRQRMQGRSVGATFDRGRDVLWLLDSAHITVAAGADGGGAMEASAATAGFARRDRYLRFERDVVITRDGRRVSADGAMVFLAPDDDAVQMIELRGRSTVRPEAGSASSLRLLAARDINLHYSGDGAVLERAVLAGVARVEFGAATTSASRTLTADWIEMFFSPDGEWLISLVARDQVQLQFPIEGGGPARRIRAASLEAAGEAGRGLTTARFVDQVNYRETRPAADGVTGFDREIRARSLDAVVTPGMGAIEAANFGGGVRFVDDSMNASAPDLLYNVAGGTAKLVATPTGGAGALVTDDAITIEARTIDMTLESNGLVADRDVRSVLKATRGQRTSGTAPRRPGMFRDDQPVNVTAAHLAYDSKARQATYTGEARLWQGETAVQGSRIVLDDQRGNLTASGSVRSTWRLADTDPKTKQVETKTTMATADDLVYEDASRRATYTTGARMNGPEGDLRADKIELYLADGGGALERAEAYVGVSMRSEGRTSLGDRLSYFAGEARYVMSGARVTVYEQLPEECRTTEGRTLTFFRSTDSISVDGNRERRTQTTSGGKCPEPPQSH